MVVVGGVEAKWFELEKRVIGTGHNIKVLSIGYTVKLSGQAYQQTPWTN